tara:strand:+ start:11437 stop:11691 length:255 start_codon:yes stop_codon:yes gene_type:complete
MKIDAARMALASGLSISIFWFICSLMVFILPGAMREMTGNMVHLDVTNLDWNLTWWGVLSGMLCWFVTAYAITYVSVAIYNRIS